jgi:hypothetical protein
VAGGRARGLGIGLGMRMLVSRVVCSATAILALLSTGATSARDLPIKTLVTISGECAFRVDHQKRECGDKLIYSNFRNHRVAIDVLPKVLKIAGFSGGRDLQLEPEHYHLTVDRITLSGGTIIGADGFCSVDLRADGQRIYRVECKALAHDGRRFELKFAPYDKPPTIMHF